MFLLLSLALPVPLLAPQVAQEPREPFSTGPPAGVAPAGRGLERPVAPGGGRSSAFGPDGSDIRANSTLTSAQNETSISVNPNDPDNWVGVANDYSPGDVRVGWYTTLDGGQTWTTGTMPLAGGFSRAGDCCVTFDVHGNVHIVAMQYTGPGGNEVRAWKSTNGGVTWDGGRRVDVNSANDKPQVDSDYSNGPHRGDVTTAWDRFGFTADDIYVSTSSDAGASWSSALRVNDNSNRTTIAPDVCYGPNSELYVGWADRGLDRAYVDKSTDGGATWGTDVIAANFSNVPSPIPGSSFRMFDIFAIDADWTSGPHSGNVYLAYHTWSGGQADVRLATSTNGGSTWTDRLVNTGDTTGADQVFPGVVVDTKGNVNLTYFDRRLDPANYRLWTWAARSSDGGVSFEEHVVSDTSWDHRTTEFGGGFIGDYNDLDTYDGLVHPFWTDGRAGNSQEVYTDKVNLDFYASIESISAASGGSFDLSVRIGPNYANRPYIIVGGNSGTTPGTTLGNGLHVDLNQDGFTNYTIANANSGGFTNTSGTLDAQGHADASIDTLGPIPASFAGSTVHFVAVVDPANPSFATPPLAVDVTP